MKLVTVVAALLAWAAGCGGPDPGAAVDAAVNAVDAPVDAEPFHPFDLSFEVNTRVLLLAAQLGDGPWQQLTPGPDNVAHFAVDQPKYAMVWVCAAASQPGPPVVQSIRLARHHAVLGLQHPCGSNGPLMRSLSGAFHSTRDAWVQAGFVSEPALASDTTYSVAADPGIHTLAAVTDGDGPRRVFLRRGVDASGADPMIGIDLDADGIELVPATVTVTGAGTDRLSSYSRLAPPPESPRDLPVYLDTVDGTGVRVLPRAAVQPGDVELVGVTAYDGTARQERTVQHVVGATGIPSFAMPPPAVLTIDRTGLTFSGDHATVVTDSTGPVMTSPATTHPHIVASATREWFGAGPNVVPTLDPTTLPGWDSTWKWWAPAANISCAVTLSRGDSDGELVSSKGSGTFTW